MFRSILQSVTFWSFVVVLIILLAVIFVVDWDSFSWLDWLIFVFVLIVPLAGYYIVFFLAKADILWTITEQGWCKIVLIWGNYERTIGPGLRWIGLPGTHSLYKRTMTFMKSVISEDGSAKAIPHNDKDVSSFKTTRYPYALPYKDQEDKHSLPLTGMITVHGTIEDYVVAFFKASDWYAEMNSHVMRVWRDDVLPNISYDEDIVSHAGAIKTGAIQAVSALLWAKLNEKSGGIDSVVDKMRKNIGLQVHGVDLVSVDPPPDWRATTLAPYKAQKEKEAAKHEAEASAMRFDDTNQALKTWREAHPNATPAQIEAKQEELRQRALAKTAGYQQVHIKGLENATTAVVGGGGSAGILVGGSSGGQNQGGGGKGGGKSGGGGKRGGKTIEPGPSPSYEERMKSKGDEPKEGSS